MGPITSRALSAISFLLSGAPLSPAGKIALFAARAFSIGGLICLAFPRVRTYVWEWIKGPQPPRPPGASLNPMSLNQTPVLAAAAQASQPVQEKSQIQIKAASSADSIQQDLKTIRAPLTSYLKQYINLDDRGYPLPNQAKEMENLRNHLEANPTEIESLGEIFGEVAKEGDAGYAHDIRTILAGYTISSYQVSKADGTRLNNVRTHSYAQTDSKAISPPPVHFQVKVSGNTILPFNKKKGAAYLDLWAYKIWVNYRLYRQEIFNFSNNNAKTKGQDKRLTDAQLAHYTHSLERIYGLYKEGYLLGRVAIPQEPKETAGHRPDMGNDILSTTLWPKEGSLVQIKLFCESGSEETVGLLLDPRRASQKDFGVALPENGGTAFSGYLDLKSKYLLRGAICLEAQHGLLNAFESIAQEGGNPSQVTYKLNTDRMGWTIQKSDARNADHSTRSGNTPSSLEILWNEMTYYKGISGDLLTGLFLKSDSESFSEELKKLFELQDHIRRIKGRFLPIFKFDGVKNQLTEIPPDRLLLNILGLTHIPPIDKDSRLSKTLKEAGITEDLAIHMSKQLPSQGNLKALFDLQLLMFNLQNITGFVSIPENIHGYGFHSYTKIRLLDNLHLVFPTTHQTQNRTARKPELFFLEQDIGKIKKSLALRNYLALAIRYNLKRFLGITVEEDTVSFDEKTLSLFDLKDRKKLDFAKVLARALQAAVLFNVFGDQTKKKTQKIAACIRNKLPYLGLTPRGEDMILGSPEMQAIAPNPLTDKLAQKASQSSAPRLKFEYESDYAQILSSSPSIGYNINEVFMFLKNFGIDQKGAVDQATLNKAFENDPLFIESEKEILKALTLLSLLNPSLAQVITRNLRQQVAYFGFSADGKDLTSTNSHSLFTGWLEAAHKGVCPPTEFPFNATSADDQATNADLQGAPVRELSRRESTLEAPAKKEHSIQNNPLDNFSQKQEEALKKRFAELVSFNGKADSRYPIFKELGLVNKQDLPLWEITPTFYGSNKHRPLAPYLTFKDMLGKHAVELMTGPAMNPNILKADQETVRVYFGSKLVKKEEIQRLITHTLAVTTDGDHQVVRPNGTQYCRTASVPAGGNIQFNAGNEMYDFRRVAKRRFYSDDPKFPYQYRGGYSNQNLKEVQNYDDLLLSDEERRRKSEGVILAGYITITAQGGYGSPRIPLDKAHRVLFIDTCGAQFEKYGEGEFVDLQGIRHSNELEAQDFIIKKGAQANKTPLIADNGELPAHQDVTNFSVLGDKNWSTEYVQMLDGAFFSRGAFQKAVYRKLSTQVLPVIRDNLQAKPFYLKATLFGGGFFAKTKNAGDLREEVTHAMVSGYVKLINEGRIPKGSIIEFPRYGRLADIEPSLKEVLLKAHEKGIEIVWSEEGDLCDFESKTSLSGKSVTSQEFEEKGALVLLNAGDAMSWKGNESSSASVESMIGNNSNLRLVFNWWANAYLLQTEKYIDLVTHRNAPNNCSIL